MSDQNSSIPLDISEPSKPAKLRKSKKQVHPLNEPKSTEEFAERWFKVFQDDTKARNHCFFHICCFGFSSKFLGTKLGHPALPNALNWRQFRKKYQVKDIKTFAEALDQIAGTLPNYCRRYPTYNKPHHDFLQELYEQQSDSDEGLAYFLKNQEIDDLKFKNGQLTLENHRLTRENQAKTMELNKIHYYLKVQGIDPSALMEGQTPATNKMLAKHAPQNLEWPEHLPTFPTPSPYHPSFGEVKQKVSQLGWGSEQEVGRLLQDADPKELDRLIQAGLPKPRAKLAKPIRLEKPESPFLWTHGLLEPVRANSGQDQVRPGEEQSKTGIN